MRPNRLPHDQYPGNQPRRRTVASLFPQPAKQWQAAESQSGKLRVGGVPTCWQACSSSVIDMPSTVARTVSPTGQLRPARRTDFIAARPSSVRASTTHSSVFILGETCGLISTTTAHTSRFGCAVQADVAIAANITFPNRLFMPSFLIGSERDRNRTLIKAEGMTASGR